MLTKTETPSKHFRCTLRLEAVLSTLQMKDNVHIFPMGG